MKEIGKVINIEDGYIYVELKKNEFCAKCWRCMEEADRPEPAPADDDEEGYAPPPDEEENVRQVLLLKNDIEAEVHDRVEIEISDNIFYVNLLIEFAMPIGDFFIGYIAGYYFSVYMKSENPEAAGLATGVIFFTLSYWLARLFSSDILISWNKYPKAVRIIKNAFMRTNVSA